MKVSTIVIATVFAVTSSVAFAASNDSGAAAPEHAPTMKKHSAVHHHRMHHHMARRSGPGLEPGAPDASRPGGKGISNKPGD
jgi:hypothetical protein